MLILGLDFETTGMEPEIHSVTEVGAVLWETEIHSPVRAQGYLVNPGEGAVWDPACLNMNGINPRTCEKFGYPSEKGLKQLLMWYNQADVLCAHNGNHFDKKFLKKWCERHDFEVDEKLWIDTMLDLPFPPKTARRLTYMAAEHGFLNPFPHRALFDVMTMLKILDQYPIDQVIKLAQSPLVLIEAVVSYEAKDLAKAAGYYWKGEKKQWLKDVKQCHMQEEFDKATAMGFESRFLEVIA